MTEQQITKGWIVFMIQLIYGQKGSGKTKRLLDMCNEEVRVTDGSVVFIDDDKRYLREVPREVRFVDVSEYDITTADGLFGFVCGMYAQNYDIGAFYIDAFLKIVGNEPSQLKLFFDKFSKFCAENNIKAVFSISANAADAPDFMKDMII